MRNLTQLFKNVKIFELTHTSFVIENGGLRLKRLIKSRVYFGLVLIFLEIFPVPADEQV